MGTKPMKSSSAMLDERVVDALFQQDGSYPSGAAFVADSLPDFEEIVLRNLVEGTPVVSIFHNGLEMLYVPEDVGSRSDTSRELIVAIYWRHPEHPEELRRISSQAHLSREDLNQAGALDLT